MLTTVLRRGGINEECRTKLKIPLKTPSEEYLKYLLFYCLITLRYATWRQRDAAQEEMNGRNVGAETFLDDRTQYPFAF